MSEKNEPKLEAALPREMPRPHEFDVDTATYCDGFAEVSIPDWLEEASARRAQERGEIIIKNFSE